MKKLLVMIIALLLMAFACAEGLDFSQYPDYTGDAMPDSAETIEKIMAGSDVRTAISRFGALKQTMYVPSGENMAFYRSDVAFVRDGFDVIQIIEDESIDIFAVNGTAYMIENGAIYTMPVENLPARIPAVDEFVFVYDETEEVVGSREWEGGSVILTRAADTWIEYFVDENMFIGAIKVYSGENAETCTAYITVEPAPAPEMPSFIIREAMK